VRSFSRDGDLAGHSFHDRAAELRLRRLCGAIKALLRGRNDWSSGVEGNDDPIRGLYLAGARPRCCGLVAVFGTSRRARRERLRAPCNTGRRR